MTSILEGGCQCGTIRYRLDPARTTLAVCHCQGCQRQSGSAFGMSLGVPAQDWQLLSGALKTFTVPCDSGRIKACAFCPDCGTRIFHQTHPDALSVKAGTLDDTSALEPEAHYWTACKQSWVAIPDAVPQFPDDD